MVWLTRLYRFRSLFITTLDNIHQKCYVCVVSRVTEQQKQSETYEIERKQNEHY